MERIRKLRKAGVQLQAKDEKEVKIILAALPVLEAERKLEDIFKPKISEDTVYDLAMQVYNNEEYAKKLVKVFADGKSPST